MSALEIVLIVVLSVLVVVIVLYLFLLNATKRSRFSLFQVINRNPELGGTVFLGDSLTDFYPIQDFFPNRLIYNRGIAGDQTWEVKKRLSNVIELAPKTIFLLIGTNDLGRMKSPRKVAQNVIEIIKIIQQELPKCRVNVISLYPVSHHKSLMAPIIAGIRTNKKIDAVNQELVAYTNENNLTYIDLNSQLKDKKGRFHKDYTAEGLHVSAEGYALISKVLAPYLDQK